MFTSTQIKCLHISPLAKMNREENITHSQNQNVEEINVARK